MMRLVLSLASFLLLIPVVTTQSAEYGQCGGIGWTGATTCANGWVCTYNNAYYSQCLPPSSTSRSTSTTASSTSGAALPTGTSNAGLSNVAKAAGKKYFGSATDNPELTDVPYVTKLSNTNDFTQITPGNSMKWDATEPEQGTWTFTNGDVIADLAEGNGQLVRGHNCVWYNQLPSWVTSGTWTNDTLTEVVANHCGTLVSHYAGKMTDSWDVINEPFNDDGTWRSDVFYNTMGEYFVPVALKAARAADPDAKLYINDYNIEAPGAKSTAMINLVKSLKAAGVPVDGVGIQGHLIVGEVPTTMQENMEAFTALGVEVAITELDIRMTLPETTQLLEQQKTDYQTVIEACNAVPGCVGITIWDYTDKVEFSISASGLELTGVIIQYSWIPSTFSGQGAACPWDANLVKKPAYDGIVAGFTNS